MALDDDDFSLFGLARRFTQDRAQIDARWKALQAQVHPDRFADQPAAGQRVAMQWAVRVNEAYQRLRDPTRRAAYLCELAGVAIDAERNTAMPTDFLVQQMDWREALSDAKEPATVARLAAAVRADQQSRWKRLATLLDEQHDATAAAREVRALMFIERFVADIDHRLEALDA